MVERWPMAADVSGWEAWTECDGTKRLTLTLTSDDARRMDPVQLAMLKDAGDLIELAFDPDTPAHLAEFARGQGEGWAAPRGRPLGGRTARPT